MKKLLCIFTTAVLLLGLWGCNHATEAPPSTFTEPPVTQTMPLSQYIPGTITGNTYENTWLGLHFVLPANMEFEDQLTRERTAQREMEQHPEDYTVQDLCVYSTAEGMDQSPVIVSVTKLGDGEQNPEALVDAWRTKIDKAYRDAESQYSIVIGARWSAPNSFLFLGHPYILQHHVTDKTEYWDLFRVQDGFLVNVHFAQPIGGNMRLEDFAALFTGYTAPPSTEGDEVILPSQTEPPASPSATKLISCVQFGEQLLEMNEQYHWERQSTGFDYSTYVPNVYESAGIYASGDWLSFGLYNNTAEFIGRGLEYGTFNDSNQLQLTMSSNDGSSLEELLWYASPLFDSCPGILSPQELVSRFAATGERNYAETVGNISYEISFDPECNELDVTIRFGKGYTLSVTEPDPIKLPFELNKVYRMTVYAENFSEPCAVDFMLSENFACYMLAGTQYEAIVGYLGTYSVEGDELIMELTYRPNSDPIHCLFRYRFNDNDLSLVQQSEQAPFGTEGGTWFSVERNRNMDSDKMKDMAEYYSS